MTKAANGPAPLLQLHAVHKHFGGVRANDGVDLSVPTGAIVGLIGPNGSGKTTLFNAVTGSILPDSGSVHFDGQDITGLGPAPTARLGLLRTFQHAGVYSGMSCLQCVLVSHRRSAEPLLAMWRSPGAQDRDRAHDLLALVGLAGKANQRQQVMGAIAVLRARAPPHCQQGLGRPPVTDQHALQAAHARIHAGVLKCTQQTESRRRRRS